MNIHCYPKWGGGGGGGGLSLPLQKVEGLQPPCPSQILCHCMSSTQLSFQRYLGPLDCFQHLRSIEMPNKCPATAQIWHCKLEKLLKLYGETTEIEYEGNVFSTPADVEDRDKTEWKAFKLDIFEEKSLSLKELATLFLRSEAKCVTFPNIKILLTIAMVLPVSTATVECSFSDM